MSQCFNVSMSQRLNASMSQCLSASAHNISIICHRLTDSPLLVLPTTIFFFAGRVIDYSYGLNLALAGKGVIVKDQAFLNLNSSQLQHKGATIAGILFIVLSV